MRYQADAEIINSADSWEVAENDIYFDRLADVPSVRQLRRVYELTPDEHGTMRLSVYRFDESTGESEEDPVKVIEF